MSDKAIIAIHGAKESGKSTLAKALEYPIYSFAGPIKAMITTLLMEAGFTLDKINYWVHDENGKNEDIPHPINCTCRRLMQTLGTEWGRNLVNHEVWVNILFNKINQWDFPRVVIDDLRFPSEVDGLQLCPHKVLFVKVVRPDQVNADNHASEHGLPDEAFDLVIVNDYNTPQKYAYHATLKVLEALNTTITSS